MRIAFLALAVAELTACGASAQETERPAPQRIPMPAAVRAAHASGTRDSSGRPGRRYWQVRNSYRISAQLDPNTSRITGRETVVFRNASPSPVSSVVLRLDQNRFRSPTRNPHDAPHATAGMTVTRLVVDGDDATIGTILRGKPGLTGTRKTSERVVLSRPLATLDSLVLGIEWHFEVPLDNGRSGLRMGRQGNRVFQVAQWYPRIAMLDDLSGWDTTSYTGDAEFHNSFSRFDVELRVPSDWLVGATGRLQNPSDVLSERTRNRLATALSSDSTVMIAKPDESGAMNDGTLTWRFSADSVSDFAWGASPDYLWHAIGVSIPGRSRILAHLLLTKTNATNVASTALIVRHDLLFNSSLLTPYPFPQLTLLDGPEGGEEYPMVIMSAGDGRLRHELWHQWFPMTIGTNETLYAFLDEGFAGFFEGLTEAGRQNRPYAPVSSTNRGVAPLIWPDDRGPPHFITGVTGYTKPGVMFASLIELVGSEAVMEAFRDYAKAWSFRHPSPWDFMFSMNRSLGRNLDAFWYRWIFSVN